MPWLPIPNDCLPPGCKTVADMREHMRHTVAMRHAARRAPEPHWWTKLKPKSPAHVVRPPPKPLVPAAERERVDTIMAAVSTYFGQSREDIVSERMTSDFLNERNVAIHFLRKYTKLSLPQIGRVIGKNHSSVIYALGRAKTLMEANPGHDVSRAIASHCGGNLVLQGSE